MGKNLAVIVGACVRFDGSSLNMLLPCTKALGEEDSHRLDMDVGAMSQVYTSGWGLRGLVYAPLNLVMSGIPPAEFCFNPTGPFNKPEIEMHITFYDANNHMPLNRILCSLVTPCRFPRFYAERN